MWGHRESSLHAFQWSQVKLVERGWKTSNQSSFATLACWVINYQTYKLQRNCSFLQMIFCKGHCALTISYHFPWMRPKNSTRPLLLPGWYAISAKRPDISWWQSYLVDTLHVEFLWADDGLRTGGTTTVELPEPALWDSISYTGSTTDCWTPIFNGRFRNRLIGDTYHI